MSYDSPDATGRLLEMLAGLSARASANEHQVQALLTVIVRAATTQATSRQTSSEESTEDSDDQYFEFLDHILLDVAQAFFQGSADFNQQCDEILEGMREAILAHDYKGAANAFYTYQRCRARPRPIMESG
jgi:hypothetical protein